MIFFINILAVEREIPHSIITENPKKDVTTIETLKKYKDKAELNITVTKLKTYAKQTNEKCTLFNN